MSAAISNPALRWAHGLVAGLVDGGVREVCVAPGARSAPLVFAIEAHPDVEMRIGHDERALAFFALGLARSTGRPVALVCTSGSAGANMFPAVVEAEASGVPLIVITADRPPELQDCGAPQAMRQSALFGEHVRWAVDTGAPRLDAMEELPGQAMSAKALRHIRSLGARAAMESIARRPGPVHVNAAFREPLDPISDADLLPEPPLEGSHTHTGVRVSGRVALDVGMLPDAFRVRLAESLRPLIIAGPVEGADALSPRRPGEWLTLSTRLERHRASMLQLSELLGAPIVADIASALRGAVDSEGRPDVPPVVHHADLLLRDPSRWADDEPDLIVRVGGLPTSKPLLQWMATLENTTIIALDPQRRFADPLRAHRLWLDVDVSEFVPVLDAIAGEASERTTATRRAWSALWSRADVVANGVLKQKIEATQTPPEAHVVASLVAAHRAEDVLVLASSMPIREADAFARPMSVPLNVASSRGVNGIDGNVSNALGIAAGQSEGRVRLLIGDVAALHDANAWLMAHHARVPVDVIVLNNDGGGIFRHLRLARHEETLTKAFLTPHGQSIARLANAFDVPTARHDDPAALVAWLEERPEGVRVFELIIDGVRSLEARRALISDINKALLAEIGGAP